MNALVIKTDCKRGEKKKRRSWPQIVCRADFIQFVKLKAKQKHRFGFYALHRDLCLLFVPCEYVPRIHCPCWPVSCKQVSEEAAGEQKQYSERPTMPIANKQRKTYIISSAHEKIVGTMCADTCTL